MSHIFDMINRFNTNRDMLKRKNKFDYDDSLNKIKIHPDKLKELSKEELDKIRITIKKQRKSHRLKTLKAILITIIIICILVYVFSKIATDFRLFY